MVICDWCEGLLAFGDAADAWRLRCDAMRPNLGGLTELTEVGLGVTQILGKWNRVPQRLYF